MTIVLTAFYLTLSTFFIGSATYIILDLFQRDVFYGLYRMFMYHTAFPFQYIGLVSIVFGLVGALWVKYFGKTRGFIRYFTILITLLLTVILSTPAGGVLWKLHDMQLGFFSEGQRFWKDLWWGVTQSVFVSPIIARHSFPFNLIGIIYGFISLIVAARISSQHTTI